MVAGAFCSLKSHFPFFIERHVEANGAFTWRIGGHPAHNVIAIDPAKSLVNGEVVEIIAGIFAPFTFRRFTICCKPASHSTKSTRVPRKLPLQVVGHVAGFILEVGLYLLGVLVNQTVSEPCGGNEKNKEDSYRNGRV